MHPKLIPHVSCWISPDFALMVSDIINNYFILEYKTKLEAAQRQLNATQQQLDAAQQQADEDKAKITELNDDLVDIDTQRIKLAEDAGHRKKDRQLWASSHAFTFLHLNEQRPLA